jgi:hypothetical protein
MSSIPLKNNTGYLKFYTNGMVEVKKIDVTVLIPRNSLNRINIYPEGRVIIHQQNSIYEYDLRVDKIYVAKISEMFSSYLSEDNDANVSADIMHEYKKTIKMIGDQLVSVCRFNVDISNELEFRFNNVNASIESIMQSTREASMAIDNMYTDQLALCNVILVIFMMAGFVALTYYNMEPVTFEPPLLNLTAIADISPLPYLHPF